MQQNTNMGRNYTVVLLCVLSFLVGVLICLILIYRSQRKESQVTVKFLGHEVKIISSEASEELFGEIPEAKVESQPAPPALLPSQLQGVNVPAPPALPSVNSLSALRAILNDKVGNDWRFVALGSDLNGLPIFYASRTRDLGTNQYGVCYWGWGWGSVWVVAYEKSARYGVNGASMFGVANSFEWKKIFGNRSRLRDPFVKSQLMDLFGGALGDMMGAYIQATQPTRPQW